MFKKILFTYISLSVFTIVTFSQAINITDISTAGHFDPLNPLGGGGCNAGQPIVTATFLSGPGTSVVGGVLTCANPCETTKVRITLSNVRWSKNPDQNWLHGISITPSSIVIANATLPNGWRAFNNSTGQCPRLGGDPITTTGVGIYFDGTSSQSCCPGATALDNIPDNNFGDPLADCNRDYGFSFDMTFCNSLITSNPFLFKLKGTADYTTGCWTDRDRVGTSQIQFVLSTTPCSVPIFSSNPTASVPTKTCSGTTVNYTSTLTSACGTGTPVTWWTAATGGTQVGSGSPFVYDPPGSACPAGTTLYAACCPIGNTCVTRRAFAIPGTCPAALAITAVNKTDPTCATPTGSINSVTVTGSSGALSYTLNPGNITNNTGVFTGLLTGINYTVTVTDASDCSAISSIITFVPAGTGGVPPIVTTNSYTYCQNQTIGIAQLSATTTSGSGVLTWYLPGSTTPLAAAPTPTTSAAGTFVYNVTQTIGTCVSALVPITVIINPTPLAPVPTFTSINYCKDSASVPLSASGTNLLWYVPLAGGGTIVSGVAPIPITANVGTFVYQVSSTLGTGTPPNACEGPKATITVNVFAAPAAPAATTSISYCLNGTATALTATPTAGNTLLWYTSATGGTGSTTAPIPFTNVATTTSYYVSQVSSIANGSCASPRTKIDVTVNALPAPPTVTTPIAYCVGATPAALTAGGTGLLWYSTATGGPAGTATAPIVSTATAGSTTYYVSQTVGTCVSNRAAIVVNIIAIPLAPTVTAVPPVCQGDPVPVLTATPAPGNTLLWYTVQTGGGTGSTTAPIPSTATVGSTTYYVSQSTPASTAPPLVPGCEGPRAAITVTINAKPAPPTPVLTPVSYCQNNVATVLAASGTGLLWYTALTGGTSGNTAAPIPSTNTVGAANYYVSQTVSGCESNRATIVVNTSPALSVNAGPDVTIAGGASTQLNGVATAGAGYTWTSNIPPIALTSTTILNPIANPAQTTIYRLTVRDLSGTCLPVFDEVKVEVVQSCINIRNAFTPNGDGINDLWFVYDQNFCLLNGAGVKASVFNRYGSKVYETKDYKNTWDGTYEGKPLPDGTYYAVLEFTLFDGSKQYKRTDVTILR